MKLLNKYKKKIIFSIGKVILPVQKLPKLPEKSPCVAGRFWSADLG